MDLSAWLPSLEMIWSVMPSVVLHYINAGKPINHLQRKLMEWTKFREFDVHSSLLFKCIQQYCTATTEIYKICHNDHCWPKLTDYFLGKQWPPFHCMEQTSDTYHTYIRSPYDIGVLEQLFCEQILSSHQSSSVITVSRVLITNHVTSLHPSSPCHEPS